MTIFKFSEKITNGIKIRFKNLLWHPVVIITNTFYVDVRIWPHNRLKNHLVLDFVSAEQSLSENFTHFWPNFSLGPPVLQFLFQKSKKTTSNAAVLFVPDDDEKNPANSEVHFASNSSGLLLLHFFNIFSNFFLSPLFRDHSDWK